MVCIYKKTSVTILIVISALTDVAHLFVLSYVNQCGKGCDRSSHTER